MEKTVDYVKSNFIRLLELAAIIVALFVTQQINIERQGELQDRMLQDSQAMAIIVQGLTVSVATIQANQDNFKEDVLELKQSINSVYPR